MAPVQASGPETDTSVADPHAVDVVMAWSVDRLGRSLIDLISGLKELHAAKVDLFLHQQDIDTTTPGDEALFQMMGVFAEFERAMVPILFRRQLV
jgi:DNA invertase Pin-like site-specific DNA recombinase